MFEKVKSKLKDCIFFFFFAFTVQSNYYIVNEKFKQGHNTVADRDSRSKNRATHGGMRISDSSCATW